tara:strand:- start:34633 stop:35661 length:1029 start_codon:yes stop_codon:yes gene_type:complete
MASNFFDMELLSPRRRKVLKSFESKIQNMGIDSFNYIPPNSGILGTDGPQPVINYLGSTNETVIKNSPNGNAWICLGKDKPSGEISGTGGEGGMGTDSIDICVGRISSVVYGNKNKNMDGAIVENNYGADAARLLVSSLTKVDKNFGLVAGRDGKETGEVSAVAMKADAVRIIGKSKGVKIVTGRSFAFRGFGPRGETSSRGGRIAVAPTIELNAGNLQGKASPNFIDKVRLKNDTTEVYHLQGVAKGENVRDAIKELSDILGTLIGIIDRMSMTQITLANATGVTSIEPWRAGAAPVTVTEYLNSYKKSMRMLRIDKQFWEFNYCKPLGFKYVASRNVFST